MAERFFVKAVKTEFASDYMTELQGNKGVVKSTITVTPVTYDYVVMTYYNDIPVVTLKVGATVQYEYGSDVPVWSTLVDVADGDHSTGFTYSANLNGLDMNTIGVYTVTLTVTDASGNVGIPLDIEITIVDTTIPVINDAETLVVTYATGSDVPTTWLTGITALDEYDGDLTSSIVVNDSAVDMVTVGTFNITYNVDDLSGNSAVQLSKTITITA